MNSSNSPTPLLGFLVVVAVAVGVGDASLRATASPTPPTLAPSGAPTVRWTGPPTTFSCGHLCSPACYCVGNATSKCSDFGLGTCDCGPCKEACEGSVEVAGEGGVPCA